MHTKCWILDGKVVLDGSCNLTHGGLDNNVEHMYYITNAEVVAQVQKDFEHHWANATPVDADAITLMQQRWSQRRSQQSPQEKVSEEAEAAQPLPLSKVSPRRLSRSKSASAALAVSNSQASLARALAFGQADAAPATAQSESSQEANQIGSVRDE